VRASDHPQILKNQSLFFRQKRPTTLRQIRGDNEKTVSQFDPAKT
jgi:hypothetical protein